MSDMRAAPPAVTARLLQELNNAIEARRVEEGFALLSRVDCMLAATHCPGNVQAPFLLCLAQWVDLGYESPQFIDDLLQHLSPESRAQMPLRDFLMVRMAEAFAAMAHEDTDRAIELLGFVL